MCACRIAGAVVREVQARFGWWRLAAVEDSWLRLEPAARSPACMKDRARLPHEVLSARPDYSPQEAHARRHPCAAAPDGSARHRAEVRLLCFRAHPSALRNSLRRPTANRPLSPPSFRLGWLFVRGPN